MLVLLHDFPDFLSEYAYSFCEEIPDFFIQIRNIVLAAYPKNIRLLNPSQVTHVQIYIFKILANL
jgi:CCR4-NOT transcription complex subunit 1